MSTAAQLFIYWRTPAAHCDAAVAAARAMQQRVRLAHPGMVAQLYLRRDEVSPPAQAPAKAPATAPADAPGQALVQSPIDACITLMETYALPGTGIDADLLATIVAAGAPLQPWLQGARHVEVFEPLA